MPESMVKTAEITTKKVIFHFIVAPYVIRSILKQIAQEFRHTWLDKTVFFSKSFSIMSCSPHDFCEEMNIHDYQTRLYFHEKPNITKLKRTHFNWLENSFFVKTLGELYIDVVLSTNSRILKLQCLNFCWSRTGIF